MSFVGVDKSIRVDIKSENLTFSGIVIKVRTPVK